MFGLSAALYFRCTKTGSGGKFCVVSHSLMCGSLTLGGHVPLRGSGNLGTWVQEICCGRHQPPCIEEGKTVVAVST